MTDMNLDEIEKLAERLWIMGGMIQMGERIEYGSDSAGMIEAATALTNMAERVREMEGERDTLAIHVEAAEEVRKRNPKYVVMLKERADRADALLRAVEDGLEHITELFCDLKPLGDDTEREMAVVTARALLARIDAHLEERK
jgi:hypothetical protein